MPSDIRLKRLERLAHQRASQMVLFELADPRLELVTLTRVKLTGDLSYITIHWSVIGDEAVRSRVGHALRDATVPVQNAIASVFHTRRSPRVRWAFDESIAGAIRVSKILDELRAERGEDADGDAARDDGDARSEEE